MRVPRIVERVWRFITHLTTAQGVISLFGALFGGGVVTALLQPLVNAPGWLQVSIFVGATGLTFGLLLLAFAGLRTGALAEPYAPRAAAPVVSTPTRDQSRWLPDPQDLGTLRITVKDFDGARRRALEAAKRELAPDVVLHFKSLKLAAFSYMTFHATSRTAARQTWLTVTDNAVSLYGTRPGSGSSRHPEGGGEPEWVWELDYYKERWYTEPWRHDPTWKDLVGQVWYRIRPDVKPLTLAATPWFHPQDVEDSESLGLWSACLPPSGGERPGSFGQTCFVLKSGELYEYQGNPLW